MVRRHREMVRRERLVEQQRVGVKRGLCRCGRRIGREERLQRLSTMVMLLLMMVQHAAADGFVRVAVVVGGVHWGRRTQKKGALSVGSQKKERRVGG